MSAAAFFDLDRTLISHSSSLELAKPFRSRGLIGRRQVLKAALAQRVFVRFGAGHRRVGQTADSAMSILRGLPVEVMREIAADAWEPVLKPLVYREALEAAEKHRERGERVFIVSAALQEVVEEVAKRLDFDGAIASRAEAEDGVFTGHFGRRLYGQAKVDALAEVAAQHEIELEASSGYSDSASDVPFLEAVGRPVAVNPDRALRRYAGERGWSIVRWHERAFPVR